MESILSFDAYLKRHKFYLWAVVVLICAVYAPVIASLVADWSHDPNYSHGFLIPFLSGYFLWEKRTVLAATRVAPDNLGLPVILASLSLLMVGHAGTEYFTMRASLVFLLAGIVLFCCGRPVLKTAFVPIAFLLFMIPLPYIVYDALAFPLKLFIAKFSVICLKLMGIVVWREGNIIQFPQTVLEVADACSGLRSLMSLLALGVALAFLTQKSTKKRLLLVVMTLPIAIFTNMLRVVGTGVLAHYYGAAAAEGFFHEFAGLAVFSLALLLLILVGMFLRRS